MQLNSSRIPGFKLCYIYLEGQKKGGGQKNEQHENSVQYPNKMVYIIYIYYPKNKYANVF